MKLIQKPNHKKFNDLEGIKFERLTVITYAGKTGNNHYWYCKCDCGKIKKIVAGSLLNNRTLSCGCLNIEKTIERQTKHDMCFSSEYHSYNHAKNRSSNPNNESYHNYGGRGIKFLYKSLEEMINDIGLKPEPKEHFTIERIDNNGHYEVGNCRWASRFEQNRNKRTNNLITYNNKTLLLSDWGKLYNLNAGVISTRLKLNWCLDCTFNILPFQGRCKHRN